ncbi:FHA domain protein [Mycobacterium xenopi 4042]|uniref:FHA domain protein n=1 Tax=Mycobacterium xenopi 4042 TaxID=1299334 RepID=X7ZN03_MYCXE|nr:FHA domain protein [Mycobacterium xenopi 4042]
MVIGRDLRADMRITHPLISRAHLLLRYDQGRWLAIDNGSLNGTFVNGRRVPVSTFMTARASTSATGRTAADFRGGQAPRPGRRPPRRRRCARCNRPELRRARASARPTARRLVAAAICATAGTSRCTSAPPPYQPMYPPGVGIATRLSRSARSRPLSGQFTATARHGPGRT